jgi:3-methylcrotonyl-CoA carboxylase alpha subunit
MPARFHISGAATDWTAEVSGGRIVLTPGGAITVQREDDRLRVEGPAGTVHGAAATAGDVVWVTVDGEVFSFTVTHGARRSKSESRDQDAFTPPMSATVVRILVAPGDAVKAGDVLIALEAMKMELPIRAPRDGIVRAINCQPGDLVQPEQILLEME